MKKATARRELLAPPRRSPGSSRAQAAELSGDRAKALEHYKAMLADDRTRLVGVQGLTRQKIEEGDTDTALALAKKAFALRPDNERMLRTLFELQSKQEDWAGARETLTASIHARLLPRDVGTRRDAVLSLADARAALAAGNTARGNEAALQANRLAPTLIPAAALAAQAHAAQRRQAQGDEDADLRLGGGAASRPRRRLRRRSSPTRPRRARRKRFADADRRRPGPRREPAARGRARARRRGLSRRAQGARRSRRDRARPPAAWR